MHGAWHSAACWQPLLPYMEAADLDVLCPDLPGHGEKHVESRALNLDRYCDAITRLINEHNRKVILVGHSMAGMVISQVAEIIPEKIARLVYLSAYLPRNGQSLFGLIANNKSATHMASQIEQAMSLSPDKRTCNIAPEDISRLFYNTCLKEFHHLIPVSFPDQATLPLSGKVRLSEQGYGSIPKTYICCVNDQVIPISHQRYMMTQQKCDEMIQLDADHSPFFSCPELLASIFHSISLPA